MTPWLSRNPSKAWGEKFFLLYTPFWIAGMAALMKSGAGARWGDLALNAATLGLLAPALLVPALLRRERRPYWLKFNLWIAIFSGIGSYFGSEYFFDVLGMRYDYPHLRWTLDSALLGSGRQSVPLIMYWSAHYYFLSYHTLAVIALRRIPAALRPLAVLPLGYSFAWTETFFMTDSSIAGQFGYQDLARMLRYGSLVYACYFVVSFPMVYRLDEGPGDDWGYGRTALDALAAGMLVLLLLDVVTHAIGTL